MKSGKQRRAEIKKSRLERIAKRDGKVDPFKGPIPDWAIPVNPAEVVYRTAIITLPLFYVDKEFICKDCGADEIWTARQQKWWYEIAKGNFESTAVRCRTCRNKIKAEKEVQRKHMMEMANIKPHPNEAFFKKSFFDDKHPDKINEAEISIVNNFFSSEAKARAINLLTSKRGRQTFVDEVRHFDYFDVKMMQTISIDQMSIVRDALIKHSVGGKVFVISVYEKFDNRWMDVDLALNELFGFLGGTIIASRDFKCLYCEGEYPQSRCLLEIPK